MIKVTNTIDRDVQKALEEGLEANNLSFSGPSNWQEIQVAAYDDDGRLSGAITGESLNKWMKISFLWVREDQRKQGVGSQLIEAAEAEAHKRGDHGMVVKTYSYQAPEFYKKHGFIQHGEVADYPPGYACLYLAKRF